MDKKIEIVINKLQQCDKNDIKKHAAYNNIDVTHGWNTALLAVKMALHSYIYELPNKMESLENSLKSAKYNRQKIIKETVGKCIVVINNYISYCEDENMSDELLNLLQDIYKKEV